MILRIAIVLFFTIIGGLIGFLSEGELNFNTIFIYSMVSFVGSTLLILIESILTRKGSGKQSIFALFGMMMGIIAGYLLGYSLVESLKEFIGFPIIVIFQLILGYVGFIVGWFKSDEVSFGSIGQAKTGNTEPKYTNKILDTSVIIDGRISDIVETGFLEGEMIVPKFVLKELQQVADSSDPLKRSRGRRGLDMLNHLRQSKKAVITITDKDFIEVKEVDNKLLKLAKHIGGVVVTNDFNLNKIAEFQGVKVLNVNELSNAVKPIVLPNEQLKITIIKEGKDQKQGIAYLDDGTMIVVDNGKDRIGQEVEVVVTSILQTPAGRMIFTQLVDDKDKAIDVNEARNNYKDSYKDKEKSGYHHHSSKK
jgi:uncharacterized protein YacL